MPQIPPILAFAVLSCLALLSAVVSAGALFLCLRRHRLWRETAEASWNQREAKWEAALESMAGRLEAVVAEWRDLEQQIPPAQALPFSTGKYRAGLNFGKRAQALRMHRRGDPPEQIAACLEVPLPELDLLLKVHHIVLSNI